MSEGAKPTPEATTGITESTVPAGEDEWWDQRFLDARREIDRLGDPGLRDIAGRLLDSVGDLWKVSASWILSMDGEPVLRDGEALLSAHEIAVRTELSPGFRVAIAEGLGHLVAAAQATKSSRQGDPAKLEDRHRSLMTAVIEIADAMVDEIDRLRESFGGISPVHIREQLDRKLSSSRRYIEQLALGGRTDDVLRRAERAVEAAEESAGIASTASLATHFQDFGDGERREARWWLAATLTVLVGSTVAAYFHIANVDDLSWKEIARRVAIGVPLGLIVAFTSRAASLHRSHAQWARHLAVQLKSIRAYTEELPETQRMELRTSFGRVVFSSAPTFEQRPLTDEASKVDATALANLIGAIRTAAK